MTVRSALVRCLASPANGFGSETQRFGKSIYSQLARVSRDLRAVSGTPDWSTRGATRPEGIGC